LIHMITILIEIDVKHNAMLTTDVLKHPLSHSK
jgi:hypothetical protein